MTERKLMKGQMLAIVVAGIALTVFAALHKNTTLAIIVFVAQGTLGSVLNAKFRNEVFREIKEIDEGLYNDMLHTPDISPKAAEREGRPYPHEVAQQLQACLRVQSLNKWMPILEVLLFFVMQVVLFGKI